MAGHLLVQLICVLYAIVCATVAQVNLAVDYPDPENYNLVTLTCNNDFSGRLNDAEFLKRAPDQDSPVQLPGSPTNGEITITLTQDKEGYFSCSSGNVPSDEIGLAAEPAVDYDVTVVHRYIIFPTADSSREVNLTCPIRPGVLSDSYSVRWESSIPGVPGFTIVDNEHYDITEDINSTSYQCKVSIQHRSDQSVTETYNGPLIVLNKLVLATIENDIQSMSVIEGERTVFTCKFSKGDISDIDINWTVDGDLFDECGSTEDDIAPDSNECYTNDTHSVLILRNVTSLSTGSYTVQCIMEQNITEEFKDDPSFQENFINSITRIASLTIQPTRVVASITPSVLPPDDPTSHTTILIFSGVGVTTAIIEIVVIIVGLFCCCIRRKKRKSMNSGHSCQNDPPPASSYHHSHDPLSSLGVSLGIQAMFDGGYAETGYDTNGGKNSQNVTTSHTPTSSKFEKDTHISHSHISQYVGSDSGYMGSATLSEKTQYSNNSSKGSCQSCHHDFDYDHSSSSVHSDKTHSTRHSSKSGKSSRSERSGRSGRSGQNGQSARSDDLDYEKHSPSFTHKRYSDHYGDHQGKYHRNHSHFPHPHSPKVPSHHIDPLSGPHYHSHRELYQPPPAPMHISRRADLGSSFGPQSSNEADGEGKEIIDEVLLMAVGCLMHQEHCQIPNCPCKQVKQRFQHILPRTPQHMQKEADQVVEEMQSGHFDPTSRRQQMRISLSSQNFSKDIHTHYHMTSRSHVRMSEGKQKFMQRRHSDSMDLTPVIEQPEPCVTTPDVVIPDIARGVLYDPAFSPAVTPAGDTIRVPSPTTPTTTPAVLLREISLSADNLPSLCLNDCPMATTPLMQLGNRPLGRITPEYVTPTATLSHCTSKGVKYFDKINDFGLEIPAGAIPEGESITIDIGVALYGPFQYPEGLRPVSPVFWVCVRDQKDFQFLKPVKVTIQHCLNLESHDEIESLGLTFLKGDHEMNPQQIYQFQQAEGDTFFNPHKRYGLFQTTHFCYLCISSKISQKTIQNALFCVYAAIPNTMSPRELAYVYFFVTFLLSTCLATVKKQISQIPELHNHIVKKHDFQFFKYCHNPALGIVLPEPSAPGWTVGLQFNEEILLSDIDFFVSGDNSKDLLKIKEEEGMYPPRFNLVISCSPTARQSQTRVQFVGAVKKIVFDIPLNPLQTSVTTSSRYDTIPQSPLSLPVFLTHIGSQIPNKWRTFGILLDIPWSELETYPAHSCMDCFARVFDTWEGKRSPEFSWETVINVLENPLLKERCLAQKVREMMTTVTTDPPDDPIKHEQFKGRSKQFEDEIPPEDSIRRQQFRHRGNQDEISEIPHGILHVDSGYGTNGEITDVETSLTRSRPPPSDLQLSPPPAPAKQKKSVAKKQYNAVTVVNKPVIRRGSSSSHGSHTSHLSVGSHISHAIDGSITTETLC